MQRKQSSTKTHNLERELIDPVKSYLLTRGCSNVVSELRFFDRGIDVYGVCDGRRTLTYAVELKLSDWQRALQQAAVYQLCSDFSYVAMPFDGASCVDLVPFRECGVGLLVVRADGTVGVMLEAQRSSEVRRHYVAALSKTVREDCAYA
jgi:hypothetical protein